MSWVLGQSPKKTISPPYPAWKFHYVLCVEQALGYCLNAVKKNKTTNEISKADERLLTYWLYIELLEIIQDEMIKGFTRSIFEIPHLDAPTANIDGSSIKNMPDLRFHLSGSQLYDKKITSLDQYAWFCECKIIEKNHGSRTYANYCDKGIQRFVDGKYAWAMPHAQMIAYVRWPSDVPDFGPEHDKLKKCAKMDGDICVTQHLRNKLIKDEPAGSIELRHLWFKFQ